MSDDITPAVLSKSDAWNLTDEIRQGFEAIHENRMAQVERLARAYEGRAWEAMGYDSFDEYQAEEFGEDLQHQRLELEERMGMVKVLADSGMAKTKIAEILGIGRATVYRDLAETQRSVSRETSSEVDAAGQSVEEVGHIDEPERQSLTVPEGEQLVIGNEVIVDNTNENPDPFKDRFAGIDFDAMIINPAPQQIIQAEPSGDTPDYFVPRRSEPDWSPPHISELPRKLPAEYDVQPDNSPEFLEPPMKLQKAGEANKTPDEKHCKTCNCNLLP